MSDNPFFLLFVYIIVSVTYWLLYLLIRPRIDRGRKYYYAFLGHALVGLFLVAFVPAYINAYTKIDRLLISLVIFLMGISLFLHHFSVMRDKQEWTGILVRRGVKVSRLHGSLSHLVFGVTFTFYGLLIYSHLRPVTTLPIENLALFFATLSITLGGLFCTYIGYRMLNNG